MATAETEEPSHPPVLGQSKSTIPTSFSHDVTEDLLYGLNLDEDTKDFFVPLVASGNAPQDELAELYDISLTAGCEDWEIMLQCVTSLRDRVLIRKYGDQLTLYLRVVQLGKGDVKSIEHLAGLSVVTEDSHKEPQPRMKKAAKEKERRVAKRQRSGARSPPKSPFWSSPRLEPKKLGADIANVPTKTAAGHSLPGDTIIEEPIKPPVTGSETLSGNSLDPEGEVQDPAHQRTTDQDNAGAVSSPQSDTKKRKRGTDSKHSQVDSSLRRSKRQQQHNGTSTFEHYNPPIEQTRSSAEARPISTTPDTAPGISANKSNRRQATSRFFETPASTKKIEKARTSSLATLDPSPNKKSGRTAQNAVSALPIPPLSADRFGLIQEELAHHPFRLLIAITFLIRTPGRVAIPVFRELMARYPTPEALAEADLGDIIPMIHDLGLSTRRCETIQKYARIWLENPPSKYVRYGVKNYPQPVDGKDVQLGQKFGPEEPEDSVGASDETGGEIESNTMVKTKARGFGTAWEIGHFTQGKYAIDSWRIFCRDVLLDRAEDWMGKGCDPKFQPEWMRVLPEDKELRACLRWMWMREGWEWNPLTGEREVLRVEMRRAVDEGRVAYDNVGQLQILSKDSEVQKI